MVARSTLCMCLLLIAGATTAQPPAWAQGCDHPQPPRLLDDAATGANSSFTSAMGWSMAADGQTVIMGDPYFDGAATNFPEGAVEIYRREGSDWVREASIMGPSTTQFHGVGICVGVDGDLAAAIGMEL